jgi:hypothetical protein
MCSVTQLVLCQWLGFSLFCGCSQVFSGTLFCQKRTLIQTFSDFSEWLLEQAKCFEKMVTAKIQGRYYQMKGVYTGDGAVHACLCMSLLWVKHQNSLPPSQTVSGWLSSPRRNSTSCPCYSASSRLQHLAKTILFQNSMATFYRHSPLESFLWVLSLQQCQQKSRRRGVFVLNEGEVWAGHIMQTPPSAQLLWCYTGSEVLRTMTMKSTYSLLGCNTMWIGKRPSSWSE